jgi:cytidylate kinase
MTTITVSTQFGAGGHLVAEAVSKRLDFAYVNEAMVEFVANKANVSKDWVKSIEKDRGDWLLNFISKLIVPSFIEKVTEKRFGVIDESIYIRHLQEIMYELAREGNCIIIGRGSQYILHKRKNVYHVLLISDLEHRIELIEKYYNLSYDESKKAIEKGTKLRKQFYEKLGKYDYNDANLYDLVINTSRISVDIATDMICTMIEDLDKDVPSR